MIQNESSHEFENSPVDEFYDFLRHSIFPNATFPATNKTDRFPGRFDIFIVIWKAVFRSIDGKYIADFQQDQYHTL